MFNLILLWISLIYLLTLYFEFVISITHRFLFKCGNTVPSHAVTSSSTTRVTLNILTKGCVFNPSLLRSLRVMLLLRLYIESKASHESFQAIEWVLLQNVKNGDVLLGQNQLLCAKSQILISFSFLGLY